MPKGVRTVKHDQNTIAGGMALEAAKPSIIVEMICKGKSAAAVAKRYGMTPEAIRKISKTPEFKRQLREAYQTVAPLMVQDTLELLQKLRKDKWKEMSANQQSKFALGLIKGLGDMVAADDAGPGKDRPNISIENVENANILIQRLYGEAAKAAGEPVDIKIGTSVLPDDDVEALLEQLPEEDGE